MQFPFTVELLLQLQSKSMKSLEVMLFINLQLRSPWNISPILENLWYDIDIRNHFKLYLFRSFFSITCMAFLPLQAPQTPMQK